MGKQCFLPANLAEAVSRNLIAYACKKKEEGQSAVLHMKKYTRVMPQLLRMDGERKFKMIVFEFPFS